MEITQNMPFKQPSKALQDAASELNESYLPSAYATDLISDFKLFLPSIEIARGIVVSPPMTIRASPAAFMASLLRRLEINMPIPAPRAMRVPVQRAKSGKETFRSLIAPPDY
jgi:hypothetical protein